MFKFLLKICCVLAAIEAKPHQNFEIGFDVLNQIPEVPEPVDTYATPVEVTVPSHGGRLMGLKQSYNLIYSYYSFKGIPYAEPPVGDLRFKAPVAHRGWEGVRNATEHGENCVQPGTVLGTSGVEDCLFLNVYSPKLDPKTKYAVMVWIHGGSFSTGNGNTFLYGPEPLVSEDVILVTINYRLGFLGFFSTGDKEAPGNYGLKDAVEALKWVKNNIVAFGGDPNRVTIFGESAGSVLVHYLVLSPLAKGLFQGAISQSGTALGSWGLQDDPNYQAFTVAKEMGIDAKSTAELVQKLKAIEDPSVFARHTPGWLELEVPRGMTAFRFSPVIDPVDSLEPRFMPDHPVTLMKTGKFNHVPYIIGSNSHESLFGIRELIIDPFLFSKFNKNPHYFVPEHFGLEAGSPEIERIAQQVRDVYFNGGPLTEKSDYVDFCSDRHFHYGVYKTAKLIAEQSPFPVYSYVFSYSGALNYVKRILLLSDYDGAMHGDDVPHLFRIAGLPPPVLPGDHAYTVRARLTKMWTDFAKYGNPTLKTTDLVNVIWEKVGGRHMFLNISDELSIDESPFAKRMQLWEQLEQQYSKF